MTDPLQQQIERLVREDISIVPFDPRWAGAFLEERAHLRASLPRDLVGRIEHFGSTAIPALCAKPIVDILVEVSDLTATRERIVPILQAQGYDYIWRPTHGDDGPPFYAWFIKREPRTKTRTHHIHMVEPHFEHWDALLFRDYLIAHPDIAREYEMLKVDLAARCPNDRRAYTDGKTAFVTRVTSLAKA